MNRKALNSGFTLIEALVVIALTGILVALAVPSMRSTIERSSISGQVNSFIGALRFARSEAIKLGTTVKMCRSTAPEASAPSCAGAAGSWASGWIIFVDRDDDGTLGADDLLLRVQGAFSDSGGITSGSGADIVYRFRPTGMLASGVDSLRFVSRSADATQQRVVCVGLQGRARITTEGTSTCSSSDS